MTTSGVPPTAVATTGPPAAPGAGFARNVRKSFGEGGECHHVRPGQVILQFLAETGETNDIRQTEVTHSPFESWALGPVPKDDHPDLGMRPSYSRGRLDQYP